MLPSHGIILSTQRYEIRYSSNLNTADRKGGNFPMRSSAVTRYLPLRPTSILATPPAPIADRRPPTASRSTFVLAIAVKINDAKFHSPYPHFSPAPILRSLAQMGAIASQSPLALSLPISIPSLCHNLVSLSTTGV
jgi:hypothetical protein